MEKLIFEYSKEGRKGYTLRKLEFSPFPVSQMIPPSLIRKKEPELPEVSENLVVRHFIRLSSLNYHIDKGFYPLGSCTMKYNPKINEELANLRGFVDLHPLQEDEDIQGALHLMKELEEFLKEISGMDDVSLQPAAGAQGELTGMLIVRKYHEKIGSRRRYVLVPDTSHGTNPASVSIAGYEVVTVPSDENGLIDPKTLMKFVNNEVAAIMITNPNTLGLFEKKIKEVAEIIHSYGALMYMDGANLNALLGIVKPGELGFDIIHFNLHKTFSTPHGGGGPGSGPVGVKKFLSPFLPVPRILKKEGKYVLSYDYPDSVGKIHTFFGNFTVFVKAYGYIRMVGGEGLRKIAENAIINSNYLYEKLKNEFEPSKKRRPMHEFVLSLKEIKKNYGVRALDFAKRLLDYGFHAPTIYFPTTVEEAFMIEPTETESKDTLDEFIEAMKKIKEEIEKDPSLVKNAPHCTPLRRLDEAKAARELDVRY